MTILANYWGVLFVLGLVVLEAVGANIAQAIQRPIPPAPRNLSGPTRGQRRRGREASWL